MNIGFGFGQTYSSLWKQADQAAAKDLPKTEQQVLQKIAEKAEKENNYGHLFKSKLRLINLNVSITPDSLAPMIESLKRQAEETTDTIHQSVLFALLSKIYKNNPSLGDEHLNLSIDFAEKSMAHPEILAAHKASELLPLVIEGEDSQYYGDDLLSLIAYETESFPLLHNYYLTTSNRKAQLFSGLSLLKHHKKEEWQKLDESEYIASVDSLIEEYKDLPEAGEAAIERYYHMSSNTDATAGQKIAYIETALKNWGKWKRIGVLRNEKLSLTTSLFNVSIDKKVLMPNEKCQAILNNARNINQLSLRFYRVNTDASVDINPETSSGYNKIKSLLTALPEHTIIKSYDNKKAYDIFKDSFELPKLPVGIYMLEFQTTPKTSTSRSIIYVSSLRLMQEAQPDNKVRFVVVDAESGQPIENANLLITCGNTNSQKKYNLLTDAQGEAFFNRTENSYIRSIFVSTKNETSLPSLNGNGRYYFNEAKERTSSTHIYTDRSLYRPGQIVHVATISYSTTKGEEHSAEVGRQIELILRNENWQEVERKVLTTDRFGTCATDFQLPNSTMGGSYHITADGNSTYFNVEEYKRPTFQVEFEEVKDNYSTDDTVKVHGSAKTYSGIPVSGAKVSYKVVRRLAFWWFNYSRYCNGGTFGEGFDEVVMAEGEMSTDNDGRFDIPVPMTVPKTAHEMFYNFVVEAHVTDIAGESHSGQTLLPLGNRKTALIVELSEKMLAESRCQATITLKNAVGNTIEGTIKYQVDGGKWATVKSGNAVELFSKKPKSGKHSLKAMSGDCNVEKEFVVFSTSDQKPAIDTEDWFWCSSDSFEDEEKPVIVQVGSSENNVYMVYSIFCGNKTLESGHILKSGELVNRSYKYIKNYGTGLLLTFAWVKHGKTFQHSVEIRKPLEKKNLELQWKTFRNKLEPGEQEEWVLQCYDPHAKDSIKQQIQLMATLYDKSLDQIAKHNWNFSLNYNVPLPVTSWHHSSWGGVYSSGYKQQKYESVTELIFSKINPNCIPSQWYSRRRPFLSRKRIGSVYAASATPMMAKQISVRADYDAAETEQAIDSADIGSFDVDEESTNGVVTTNDKTEKSHEETAIRENLQETAFFYPQLQTNKDGEVCLKFILPESLTTWHFMALAHTTDMKNGMIEDDIVAQKKLMVSPNIPRFIRKGDKAIITARIFNATDTAQQTLTKLLLLVPETEEVVYEETSSIVVEAQKTECVSFNINTDEIDAQLLICRVYTIGNDFSDGEQQYLPILSDKESVITTRPFVQHKPGTAIVNLDELIPDDADKVRLTYEYTNNPAWLMIQSLPTLVSEKNDNAIAHAASYYATKLGLHILSQNPSVKNVFQQWQNTSMDESSMRSNLATNQELKDISLEESPWVSDAKYMEEQKHSLGLFFDSNIINQRLSNATESLSALQNTDGSWSWWEGMRGSTYITIGICEMLVRLNIMTSHQEDTKEMLDKAFGYLGKAMTDLVNDMKKEEKKGIKQMFPSRLALEWLYICAIDGRILPSDVQQSNYYLKTLLLKDIKNQTIFEKALSAIILNKKSYVESLKEWSVYTEEMGRYYDTPRAGYSWRDYRIPTQVAVIEALQKLMPKDTITISEMQRWLLQQKRSQSWDSPLNSIDAIYAFLNCNSKQLKAQTRTTLSVDDKPLDLSGITTGIGYTKGTINNSNPHQFIAEKTSSGTSWGAIYAHFLQPTKNVMTQSSGMKVKRELIDTSTRKPIKGLLRVGQHVVCRITIESERDMDFVQVIDNRPSCLEPLIQKSEYHHGYYEVHKDYSTRYYFDLFTKGKHIVETEYYVDRSGEYETGTCTAQCAYATEFRATEASQTLKVEK